MATQAVGVGHPLRVENLPHFVRLVTIHARRQHVGFFLPGLAANDLAMHLLDGCVALGTRLSNVAAGDGGVGVGVRQDAVRGVAGGAVRGNNEPFLQQAFPVDALGIILQNVVLFNGTLRLHRRALAVAFAASDGNVEREYRRAAIFDGEDVVVAVAIDAARRQHVTAGRRLAVQRLGVLLGFAAMAGAAVHLGYGGLVRQFLAFQRSMAGGAGERTVNRRAKLLRVHVERDGLGPALGGQALVFMTGQAVGVAGCICGPNRT